MKAALRQTLAAVPVLCLLSPRLTFANTRIEPDLHGPDAPASLQALRACSTDPLDGDFDQDGICDEVEQSSGTRANKPDSDGDGVTDGEEDKDKDGVVDTGESDPRSPGLFPGGAPHIPEPLVFDLVRALGAKKSEVEVNTLAVALFPPGEAPSLHWAPEIEWAILDGLAVELELPLMNRELHAIKGAVQYTLPSPAASFAHGLQSMGEIYLGHEGGGSTALLYIAGGRSGAWSVLSLTGGRVSTAESSPAPLELLLNPSLFYDVRESLTVGLETNLASDFSGLFELRVVPQLHYQLTERVRVQLGGGFGVDSAAERSSARLTPLVTTRLILE